MPGYEETRADWDEAECGREVLTYLLGTCEPDLRFLYRHSGYVSDLRYFDDRGSFVGLATTTDVSDPVCQGHSYWPDPVLCREGSVAEIRCGDTEQVRLAWANGTTDGVQLAVPEDGAAPPESDSSLFFAALRPGPGLDEVEGYPSLAAMADAADLVVAGRFASFRRSRDVEGDAVEDVVTYGAADLVIEELLRGVPVVEPVPVEFMISEEDIPELNANLPEESLVVFLREKTGEQEQGLYRLVNSLGLWRESEGSLTPPLAEDPGAYQAELQGLTTLPELMDLLRE